MQSQVSTQELRLSATVANVSWPPLGVVKNASGAERAARLQLVCVKQELVYVQEQAQQAREIQQHRSR